MKRALVALALLAPIVAPAMVARADESDVPTTKQKMKFTEGDGVIRVSTSIAKLFDSAAYEELGSGFESTIVIRMWVYPQGGGDAVSYQVLERRVIYDHWGEVYELELDGPGGRQKVKVKYRAEALKLLTTIDRVPIASSDELPYDKHYLLRIVVELNPVDEETLAEVRRWLTESTGAGGMFGSVVSVFVNPKIEDADRVLKLRSQPFFRQAPAEEP